MNWFFRPSTLFYVSVVLALSALALVLWPWAPGNQAIAQPVTEGDQEVAWLYAATNTAPWERFVSAARRAPAEPPGPQLEVNTDNAFPHQTTAVPELSVGAAGKQGRLWFRWYKLTSEQKTADWVRALLARRPAPLAVIGGSSSDLAIELARSLRDETDRQGLGPAAPLLLLTAATADEAGPEEGSLAALYARRTFRFCFTNRQMAEAVTHFIWSRNDLRPDHPPVYLPWWEDDPYSRDLNACFLQAVDARLPAGPAGPSIPVSGPIPYSIGMYDRPNRWEIEVARHLIDTKLAQHPRQRQPLLLLPAASQPARRFLRALVQIDPTEARHFVVATGDGIGFNLVYRDRDIAWPIQDLPFRFVFFCHRNPVDRAAGFVPETAASPPAEGEGRPSQAGTEDLLLFADIVRALTQDCYQGDRLLASPAELGNLLRQARCHNDPGGGTSNADNPLLFDDAGNRRSGTGEHIVYLDPVFKDREVLPRSTITVWWWRPTLGPQGRWEERTELNVTYAGAVPEDTN